MAAKIPRQSGDWFDVDAFRQDVRTYMKRQGLTAGEAANLCDLSYTTVTAFLAGGDPSLPPACALADLCDLSLDVYRLTLAQHDEVVDNRISDYLNSRRS